MKLSSLEIQALPGIEPGFELHHMAAGTNIVTGPNGIGKSSLVRALGYLVSTERTDPPALALKGRFEIDGVVWTAQRLGSRLDWSGGNGASVPALPSRDQLHCYWLSMEDLLGADRRDDLFIREIRKALSGGFDLDALRAGDRFSVRPRGGAKETRQLAEAEVALRAVESEYHALDREEQRLPELGKRIEDARRLAACEPRLEAAMRLLDLRRQKREASVALESFPIPVAKLKGDESERLKTLQEKAAQLESDVTRNTQRCDEARTSLERTRLMESSPAPEVLQARDDELQQALRARDDLDRLRTELRDAREQEQRAREGLGGSRGPVQLTPEQVSEAEELAHELHETRRQIAELTGQLKPADETAAPNSGEIERQRRAGEALAAWLAAAGASRRGLLVAAAVGAVGALVAIVAAALMQAWVAVAGAVGALAAIVWLLRAAGMNDAGDARSRFAQTRVDEPERWNRSGVEKRRDEIEQYTTRLEQARLEAMLADQRRRRLDEIEAKLGQIEQRRRDMAEAWGFDPEITGAGLDRFIRLSDAWFQADVRARQLQSRMLAREESLEQSLRSIGAFLGEWGVELESSDDTYRLKAALDDLAMRERSATEARRTLEDARAERSRLQREVAENEKAMEKLFAACGIEPGDVAELERCTGLHDAWMEQREQLRDLESRERQVIENHAQDAHTLEWIDAGDGDAIAAELERSREARDRLEHAQDELTRIRTRLEDAGRDLQLENALAHVDQARSALETQYHEAMLANVAQGLIDSVEREFRNEQEPDVLRAARERFAGFTHHAWSLEVGENGFRARESSTETLRELKELSSGTRMQLLLAVRLAWTSRLERHTESLPLILDEALTTSDEARFRSVVNTLEHLAREEHRQVFYLCARRNEIDLWQHVAGHRPNLIDLGKIRLDSQAADAPEFEPPKLRIVPVPGAQSATEYARTLGVPAIDPRALAGAVHLFHIMRDELGLLHDLLSTWRVATIGQFEDWLRGSAAHRLIDDEARRRRLQVRCGAVRAWLDSLRQGSGKPVDRGALVESQAVSDKFLESLTELAESLDGDGRRLIEALRTGAVAKFQNRKINELEHWLGDNGYTDPREVLSADQRLRSTLENAEADADFDDIAMLVGWLEQAVASPGVTPETRAAAAVPVA